MPAFANATSSRPYAATAPSIARSSATWSVTSATAPRTSSPSPRSRSACSSTPSASRSISVTRAPCAASTSPYASPSPLAPPVTIAPKPATSKRDDTFTRRPYRVIRRLREETARVLEQHLVDLRLRDACLEQCGQDRRRNVQPVGDLALEDRVADHEVVEGPGVVAEVELPGVALADERGERPDAVGVRVEVLDVDAVVAEPCAGVGDRALVVEVVAVAHVGDHDPVRRDARIEQEVEGEPARLVCRVRVHHHRRVRLDRRGGDAGEDARDVAHDPVHLDAAL